MKVIDLFADAHLAIKRLNQEPEGNFEMSAWQLAEVICHAQMVRTDGSVEKGLKRIGTRSFNKWVDAVERVIEQENPKEEEE